MLPAREQTLTRLHSLMRLRGEVDALEQGANWEPAFDWLEADLTLTLVMDLPGVDPETLQIAEDGEGVTVTGEREELILEGEFIYQERPVEGFSRRLEFPLAVREGAGEARLRNGVLTVIFDKLERTIDVESK